MCVLFKKNFQLLHNPLYIIFKMFVCMFVRTVVNVHQCSACVEYSIILKLYYRHHYINTCSGSLLISQTNARNSCAKACLTRRCDFYFLLYLFCSALLERVKVEGKSKKQNLSRILSNLRSELENDRITFQIKRL